MKITRFFIYCPRLCVGLLTAAVLLFPVQETQGLPVPSLKPNLPDDFKVSKNDVPLPAIKPIFTKLDNQDRIYELKSLNLENLLSLQLDELGNKENNRTRAEPYSNGYKPLSAHDSKLYAKAFKLQHNANWSKADAVLYKINDRRLMGHVKYQRYMHPLYKSDFIELKNWLDRYSDYPNADKIYKLAKSKQGNDYSVLFKPEKLRVLSQIKEPTISYPKRYITKIKRNDEQDKELRILSRKIRAMVRVGKMEQAISYLASSPARKTMDKVEVDRLITEIASGYLYRYNLDQALIIATKADKRSGKYVPDAAWVAGLTLWQKKDFAKAATYFEKVGASPYASGWRSSAGYYWAARSYSRTGEDKKIKIALNKAASHSRTFYGLIALKILGKKPDFNWDRPKFSYENETLLLSTAAGQRAFSLVAAGQYDKAEEELLRLNYKGNMALRRAVLSYATHVGLSGISLRLGNMVRDDNRGGYYDSALYPVVPWSPKDGYEIDPALIHAVMRQESRFDQQAKSYSGALGLMQLMPKTAEYMAKKKSYDHGVSKIDLADPSTNMTVGQDYLQYLLKGKVVRGDIISLLIAYNAGPGNLLKWKKRNSNRDDPLLFIETLPVKETRDYVVKVMSNYWIYRMRAGQNLPSLTALAGGKAPRYASYNGLFESYKLSSNP